jgi:transposase
MRAVVNALMYILSTGCQWRYLPKDFPPHSTVYDYFVWWQCDRVLDRVHHALYVECRERAEREASPTAAIIDSQSERTIAWLNRYRRLAKDWENLNRSGLAFLKLASIRLMLRELCNP